jgi:anaerobic ribonucleoside-triphosphate reductase
MVIKALLEGSIKGIGNLHKTSIFPCGIFQCMIGVNRKPGDPNYDLFKLALKSTSKRLYPNYCNCDVSMQKDANLLDVQIRQSVLDELSAAERLKLINAIKENPELKAALGIEVED